MEDGSLVSELVRITSAAMSMARRCLAEPSGSRVLTRRADGDVTRSFDREIETLVIGRLREARISARVVSEESQPVDLVPRPRFIVLLDPLDGSDIVARGYPFCSVTISIHDIDSMATIVAVCGDVFRATVYVASRAGAFRTSEADDKLAHASLLKPSQTKSLRGAMGVTYAAKPDRLATLMKHGALLSELGLLLNYGGSLDIAKVGSGLIDVYLELGKGFAPLEYVAGMFIAMTAGAIGTDLTGNEIRPSVDLRARQQFVVSSNPWLHDEVLSHLSRG